MDFLLFLVTMVSHTRVSYTCVIHVHYILTTRVKTVIEFFVRVVWYGVAWHYAFEIPNVWGRASTISTCGTQVNGLDGAS